MLHVTLEVPLTFFTLGGCRQSNDTGNARTETLGDALDATPFAGRIASFKNDDNLEFLELDPFLQLDEFNLQASQRLFVFLVVDILLRLRLGRLGSILLINRRLG